jgi:transposase
VDYDAGKKVRGRKIHAWSTVKGWRCGSSSTPPPFKIATGPFWCSTRSRRFPWLELIWADGGYNAWQVEAAVAKVPRLRLAIVKRSDDVKGFVVLSRRWVVERTFSWFGSNQRLAKDFANLAENPRHLRHPRFYPARPQAACTGVRPDWGQPSTGSRRKRGYLGAPRR